VFEFSVKRRCLCLHKKLKRISPALAACAVALAVVINICLFCPAEAKAQPAAKKNVLIIHSYDENYKWTSEINRGMLDSLPSGSLNIYTDYLDARRVDKPGYYDEVLALQRIKYQGISFDLILCSDNEALYYSLGWGSWLFGETPVVFCGADNFSDLLLEGRSNYTGVVEKADYRATIEGIIKMQPDLRTIYILSTDSALSSAQRADVQSIAQGFGDVDFVFDNNLEEGSLADFGNRSCYDTAVLMLADPVLRSGSPAALDSIGKDVVEGINLPVYTTYGYVMGNGFMGGKLVSGYLQGKGAGEMASRLLAGDSASEIPVVKESPNVYTYDYSAMKKYGILKANLPSGSEIINKPFSFLETYRNEALALLAAFVLLAALIALLVINIRKRKQSEVRYQLALGGTNDAVWELDIKRNRFKASGKWKEITGYDPEVKVDLQEYLKYVHPDDRRAVFRAYTELKDMSESFVSEFRLKVASGEYKWLQARGKVLRDNEKNMRAYGYIGDISSQKKYEEEIRHLAYYDKLTGLMNRASVMKMLDEKLVEMQAKHEKGAVFFVDLDDFKRVNDTMGHDCGDSLLAAAAARLTKCAGVSSFVGRLSGDEFLVIKYGTADKREITDLAYRLTQAFIDSFTIKDKQVFVTASVGVTLYPEDGSDSVSLLKNADTAMYKAKESGKNKFRFYSVSMNKDMLRKAELDKGLREAVKNGELQVHYQPCFSFDTAEITGFEALLRWNSRSLGYVTANEFIAAAEETGFMVELGKWVLETVCRQNKLWRLKGLGEIFTSVNISALQINDSSFLETVRGTLGRAGLPTSALGIEIKESVIMGDIRYDSSTLEELSRDGVRISLDDFGTGYSSLTYLARIPLDSIKVDRTFTEHVTESSKTAAIIHGVVELSHKMGLKVVAEGVSRQEQYDLLKEIGCDEVQGFLTGKPMPAEEAEDLLRSIRKQ
jgi:diguanylate cyclase (GGDEF)-like protein/PAS domain S-box-containing protein